MTTKKDYYEQFYKEKDWLNRGLINKAHLYASLKLLKNFHKHKISKILDIGCGTGILSHIFQSMGYEVTGIDFAESAILKAKEKYNNIEFYCQDASNLNLNKKYDLIFVSGFSPFNTLNFQSVHEFIGNWGKYLTKNGVILIIGKTNFTGKSPTGWIYHTKTQIEQMYKHDMFNTKIIYIHSKLGYLILLPLIGNFFVTLIDFLSRNVFARVFNIPIRNVVVLQVKQ